MEVVCKSDYQDIYRITGGVLLVVNKWEGKLINGEYVNVFPPRGKRIWKKYAEGCQDLLRVLTKDYVDKWDKFSLPKGTVLYNDRPIQIADRKNWHFQIKTSGECFGGISGVIIRYIDEIKEIMHSYDEA